MQTRYSGIRGDEGAFAAHAPQASGGNQITDGAAHRDARDAISLFQNTLTWEDVPWFQSGVAQLGEDVTQLGMLWDGSIGDYLCGHKHIIIRWLLPLQGQLSALNF